MKTYTSRLASVLSITALAFTMGCAGTAKTESTGEYFDDTAITGKVKSAIFE